ncbi:MAG: UDP-N-acetylmuramate dehydrogenase, partial [Candidatus Saccharimonas sp.]
ARFIANLTSAADIPDLVERCKAQSLPIHVLGSGSNTIVRDTGFAGLILRNRIAGYEVIAETNTDATIKIGAGEIWDEVVKKTVDMNLSGIECLSSIPGTAGAAPVQNIGAYGQDLSEVFVSLEAYDMNNSNFATLSNEECKFGYRSSIFRTTDINRYIITSIMLRLYKTSPKPPFYDSLQTYLDDNNITSYTVQTIRDAVATIRYEKLPNPERLPNSGSFFKNAVVEEWQLNDLRQTYSDAPAYEMGDGKFKIPTGWLIEKAGLKGELLHGMRVHTKNALVLINESATSYQDLSDARDQIIGAVRDQFRIQIEQEPLEI